MRVGRWLIYGIIDPRRSCLIYVGKTQKRREIRLREHIERAREGGRAPLHRCLAEMLEAHAAPDIFVLRRLPPNESWQAAERREIAMWRAVADADLPIVHPPQTPKSVPVTIRCIRLLNVRDGG